MLFLRGEIRKAETNKQEFLPFFLSNKDFQRLHSFSFVWFARVFLTEVHQITSLAAGTFSLSWEAGFFNLSRVEAQSPRSFCRCYLGLSKVLQLVSQPERTLGSLGVSAGH